MKYLCTFCNVYLYDEDTGDPDTGLLPGTRVADIPDSWRCPVCGMPRSYLQPVAGAGTPAAISPAPDPKGTAKDLTDYRNVARKLLAGTCTVNPVCDGQPGRLCIGQHFGRAIGLGGAGQGMTFGENYRALQRYRFRTRVVRAHHEPEMGVSVLGKEIAAPVMGASLSGVKNSLNDAMPEDAFFRALLRGARTAGSIGMVGSSPTAADDLGATIVGEEGGWGIPLFKPQSQERLIQLFHRAEEAGALAIGVDLDGCGSTYWEKSRVYRKSEKELQELVQCTGKPVIFKGIMTVEDAGKVVDSGARVCYVSNHGGRVLDSAQGVADVLPGIAREYRDRITIMADGAVRTGFDVLKLVALGAHVALIGRPLARMAIAGGPDAVQQYFQYVRDDLRRAMILTGCDTLRDATREILVPAPAPPRGSPGW